MGTVEPSRSGSPDPLEQARVEQFLGDGVGTGERAGDQRVHLGIHRVHLLGDQLATGPTVVGVFAVRYRDKIGNEAQPFHAGRPL